MKTLMVIMRSVGCDVNTAVIILPLQVAAKLFTNLLKIVSSKNDNVELSAFSFLILIG